jgi:hypothetical protein
VAPLTRGLTVLAVAVWLVAAGTAFVYRDALAASNLGALALVVLAFPFVLALYMLAEAVGEGVVFLLVLSAFKLVTLGLIRTEFTSHALSFPWYGFVRDQDGRLVASEGCVYIIGIAVYIGAGVGWHLWYR